MESLSDGAKTAVRAVRRRTARATKQVPTDRTSLSIAVGVIAGLLAAGVAIFMNRDRLRNAATSGGEKLRRAADDFSLKAHERIDQARDNITRFRQRGSNSSGETTAPTSDAMAING
jgi:hypothetical protein